MDELFMFRFNALSYSEIKRRLQCTPYGDGTCPGEIRRTGAGEVRCAAGKYRSRIAGCGSRGRGGFRTKVQQTLCPSVSGTLPGVTGMQTSFYRLKTVVQVVRNSLENGAKEALRSVSFRTRKKKSE
ncbi:hypothetical protein [Alistipes sp.]|uniref:hypothetical protein n=1 Tax=Alistipes sp. TaxID=1872444 RepID=UPI003AB1DC86